MRGTLRRSFPLLLALAGLSFAARSAVAQAPANAENKSTKQVCIYDHSEGSAKAPPALMKILTVERGFACRRVTPADIRAGCLKECDVLIVPGGSGSKQAENLEPAGREAIRDFVSGGGAYVGICAGSYLATTDYDWSLGILNAKVLDRKHWARGTGDVKLSLTPAGKAALKHDADDVQVYYGQGPLLAPGEKDSPAPYEALATYASEIAKNGAPKGVMLGTTAVARGQFGKGRVICYSPHCEVKDGPNHLILSGVLWAAGK